MRLAVDANSGKPVKASSYAYAHARHLNRLSACFDESLAVADAEWAVTINVEVCVARLHEPAVNQRVRHVADLLLIDCAGDRGYSQRRRWPCWSRANAAAWHMETDYLDSFDLSSRRRGMRCALSTLKAFQVLKPIAGLMPSPLLRATQGETTSSTQASVTMLAGGRIAAGTEIMRRILLLVSTVFSVNRCACPSNA